MLARKINVSDLSKLDFTNFELQIDIYHYMILGKYWKRKLDDKKR